MAHRQGLCLGWWNEIQISHANSYHTCTVLNNVREPERESENYYFSNCNIHQSTNINNQYIVNIQTATSMTRDFELQQFISYRAIQHETNIQQSNILCKIWSREVLNPFHFKGERGLFHNSIRNIRDVDSKRRFDLALERRYFSRESRAC